MAPRYLSICVSISGFFFAFFFSVCLLFIFLFIFLKVCINEQVTSYNAMISYPRKYLKVISFLCASCLFCKN